MSQSDNDAEKTGVEPDLLPLGALTAWVIGLTVIVIVLVVGVWQYFHRVVEQELMAKDLGRVHTALTETRAQDDNALANYALVDEKAGTHRLPIARAVDLLLADPTLLLPAAQPAPAAATGAAAATPAAATPAAAASPATAATPVTPAPSKAAPAVKPGPAKAAEPTATPSRKTPAAKAPVEQPKKAPPVAKGAGSPAAPKTAAPKTAAPKTAAPKTAAPKTPAKGTEAAAAN